MILFNDAVLYYQVIPFIATPVLVALSFVTSSEVLNRNYTASLQLVGCVVPFLWAKYNMHIGLQAVIFVELLKLLI